MLPLTDGINHHISNYWNNLPPDLKRELLIGSVGKSKLINQAEKALRLANSGFDAQPGSLVAIGSDLLLASWEHDPLDGALAGQILAFDPISRSLPGDLFSLLKAICAQWKVPSQAQYFEQIFLSKDTSRAAAFLEEQVSTEPMTLYWWRQIHRLAILEGELEWAERLLMAQNWPHPLDRLQTRLAADLAFLGKRFDLWQQLIQTKTACLSHADRCLQLGNAAFLENNRQRALALWMQSLSQRPWQSNLILRLYDTLKGIDLERKNLPGHVSICLYSYNKSDELNLALKKLLESELGNSEIFVLVNGSVDNTRTMLNGWQQKVGSTPFHVIDLPVNIGAPAARNWLMHHPRIQESDWVAYLDDDALVPPDWLSLLGTAVSAYPQAGAWGCRVIDYWSNHILQSVDYHLSPPLDSSSSAPFAISMMHYEVFDSGQFSYLRPCAHATGCCHLFSRKTLQESGDFDLRFSPSQFDDLEHDFRFALAQRPVVYNGHLAVRHMNKTGKQSRVSKSQQGSAGANLYKLHNKYSPEEYAQIMNWTGTVLEADFLSKLKKLEGEA